MDPAIQNSFVQTAGQTVLSGGMLGGIRPLEYTFPVLLAASYVRMVSPALALPTNWLIADGRIRLEGGFSGDPEVWLDAVQHQIDQFAPAPAGKD